MNSSSLEIVSEKARDVSESLKSKLDYLMAQLLYIFLNYISFLVPFALFISIYHAGKLARVFHQPNIYWNISQISVTLGSLIIVAASFFRNNYAEDNAHFKSFRLGFLWILAGFVSLVNFMALKIVLLVETQPDIPKSTLNFANFLNFYLSTEIPETIVSAIVWVSSMFLIILFRKELDPEVDYFVDTLIGYLWGKMDGK